MADPLQARLYRIFTVLGFMIIMIGFIVGFMLSVTVDSYFGENTKAERDVTDQAALSDDLVAIGSTPKWLEPFIFLGVAFMIFGIALAFSTIPEILSLRGDRLSAAFPKLAKGGNK